MLKEALRQQLIRRRVEAYEARVRDREKPYDIWVREREHRRAESDVPLMKYRVIRYDALTDDETCYGRLAGHPADAADRLLVFVAAENGLVPNAPARITAFFSEHPETDLLYGDEDELLSDGRYDHPYFKPDWSPDTYLSAFYTGSMFAVRERLFCRPGELMEVSLPEALRKAAPADRLFYRLAYLAGGFARREGMAFPIGHISEICYHRNTGEDLFYGRRHEESALPQLHACLHPEEETGAHPEEEDRPLISIIIPSKDHPDLLMQCIASVTKTACAGKEGYRYEIIVVDNGSNAINHMRLNEQLPLVKAPGLLSCERIYKPMPFNFSGMCNLGAKQAKGKFLLFLNDDIEATQEGWIEVLCALADRPWTGAAGMKLIYPGGDIIQHCGITKLRAGPVHKLQQLPDTESHYFGYNRGIHDFIGVTGACLMIRSGLFYEAGAFDEGLSVSFNDVSLCYRLVEMGCYNVCCNSLRLTHHESLSRGNDNEDPVKMERLAGEYERLCDTHAQFYHLDPFYHKFLTDNDQIHGNVVDTGATELTQMPYTPLKRVGRLNGTEDACVRTGVEYAGTMRRWLAPHFRETESADGYYIKGYCFVIGADNACYDKKAILQPVAEGEAGIYVCEPQEMYRPDIEKQIPDQTHVALTGFSFRLAPDALPEGTYRVGILARSRVSRQRLYSFGEMVLRIRAHAK